MSAMLCALLALPSLGEARLLSDGADTRVDRVIGLGGGPRPPAAPADDAGSRVALVLLDPVGRFDAQFDVFLRRGSRAQVAAVLFATADSAAPGLGTMALARRLGVALVQVPDPWAASIVLHEQLAGSEAPAARLTRRVAETALAAGPDVGELLDALQEDLGYDLHLIDAAGRVLRGDVRIDDVGRSILIASGEAGRPVRIPNGAHAELIAVPVGTGIGPRSWLAAAIPVGLAAEAAALGDALQTAGIAVGHRLALARLADERDVRYRTALLDELRAVDTEVSTHLAQRAIAAGWQLDAWHIGLRITSRIPADVIALRGDVEAAFRDQGLRIDIVEQDDGWIAWTSHRNEPSVAEVRALSTRIRHAQSALRSSIPSNLGVGRLHPGALGLARSLGEASDAVRLAANRPESGHFVHIDTLGLAQLLLAWTQTDTFLPAARELLAPLERATGDLRRTLAVYLDAGASVTETAAILDLHRNTVANRLAQIQRLLGVDLGDPETRLALHLATRTVT